MDGAPHSDLHSPDRFRADDRQPPGQFIALPGLTAPAGGSTFHFRKPTTLVTPPPVGDLWPVPAPAPDPSPAPVAPEVDALDHGQSPQQPVMPRPAAPSAAQLAEVRAAALAEGHALGRAEAEQALRCERDAVVAQARILASALSSLADPPVAEVDALAHSLNQAVSRLASERAGLAIDAAPEAFARRVARMAERVAQGMRDISIHLHPDDLEALRPVLTAPCLPEFTTLMAARLVADAGLSRGDADLRAPGMRLADLIAIPDDPSKEPRP